jgi:hypothetical protein
MELLRCLPPSTGMAFVIVQHLDSHNASRRGPGDCLRYRQDRNTTRDERYAKGT